MPTLAIATCQAVPDLDPDEHHLRDELIARGCTVDAVVWTDASVDWSAFDAVLIRSTWDYAEEIDAFLAWVDRTSAVTRLLNPAEVVRWNTDKHYLAELAAAGIPTVPTTFVEPGESFTLEGLDEFVVKPAVSCGSRDTMRYSAQTSGDAPRAHVQRLLDEGRAVMIQPYLTSVDTVGESALIAIAGAFSHSIRKGQMLSLDAEGDRVAGLYVREEIDPRTPSDAELAVAERVLEAIPGGRGAVLYARIDLIQDADGNPVLLELELTEPSLFFRHGPGASARMATSVLSRL